MQQGSNSGLLFLILTRVSSLGCVFWQKAMTNTFSVFSVKLLSYSSLNVLWVCLGKRTWRRSFHGPNPSPFSHQTWHVLLDCVRGTSRLGAGCCEAYLVLLWDAVPEAQAVTTCCLDSRVAENAFIQITRFEASSLISTSNLHKAILFSQHVWSPVVLYYYYFFLLHPLYKFHSCKLPLQLLFSSW